MHSFVGRQPIFDRNLKVHGYELLFRAGEVNSAGDVDDEFATSNVLIATFSDIGLERIVGPHLAFVNLGRDFLISKDPLPLPPERVVLEVLEDVAVDEHLVDAVTELSSQGFCVALDDYVDDPCWAPLLSVADVIKVEVPAYEPAALEALTKRLKPLGVKLLAEKVETREEFSQLHAMGFDYFQGYFLSRPEVLSGRRAPSSRLATMRLLAQLQRPDAEIEEVEQVVQSDVSLSYRLLRFINSASVGLPKKVNSIHHALVYLGLRPLKRWATLIALTGSDDKPGELVRTALARARMCELLGRAVGRSDPEAGFTTGLFSALDALLDSTFDQLLAELPLSDAVRDAIRDHAGPLGEALACTLAYERCNWSEVAFAALSNESISGAYADSVAWSREITEGLLKD